MGVNGVVRATFRSYRSEDGEENFAAMLPETAFVPGPNKVELYLVHSEGAGTTRLIRVERRQRTSCVTGAPAQTPPRAPVLYRSANSGAKGRGSRVFSHSRKRQRRRSCSGQS